MLLLCYLTESVSCYRVRWYSTLLVCVGNSVSDSTEHGAGRVRAADSVQVVVWLCVVMVLWSYYSLLTESPAAVKRSQRGT